MNIHTKYVYEFQTRYGEKEKEKSKRELLVYGGPQSGLDPLFS